MSLKTDECNFSTAESSNVPDYKVTIIVGIYNSAAFLKQGLESLSNQTWKNIEVLMMNDGSTDASGEICDQFAANDSRFIAVHKKNSGVCDSRNMGLDMASGDYVCFMDGDDWFHKEFIEYMISIIKTTNTSMALSDNLFTTDDCVQVEKDEIEKWDYIKTIKNIIYPYMYLGPWNKIYSMKVIKKYNIRFPSHWFGETLHFANTIAYYSKEIGVGHRKVYYYRLNNLNSGTTQYSVQRRLLSLDNAKKLQYCCFSNNIEIKNAIAWHLYANYFNLLVHIIATNSESQYREEYKEAISFMRRNWVQVFFKSELRIKQRIAVVVEALFPRTVAKHKINSHNKRLNSILQSNG